MGSEDEKVAVSAVAPVIDQCRRAFWVAGSGPYKPWEAGTGWWDAEIAEFLERGIRLPETVVTVTSLSQEFSNVFELGQSRQTDPSST